MRRNRSGRSSSSAQAKQELQHRKVSRIAPPLHISASTISERPLQALKPPLKKARARATISSYSKAQDTWPRKARTNVSNRGGSTTHPAETVCKTCHSATYSQVQCSERTHCLHNPLLYCAAFRPLYLLIAPFLLHRSTLHCYSVPWQTAT